MDSTPDFDAIQNLSAIQRLLNTRHTREAIDEAAAPMSPQQLRLLLQLHEIDLDYAFHDYNQSMNANDARRKLTALKAVVLKLEDVMNIIEAAGVAEEVIPTDKSSEEDDPIGESEALAIALDSLRHATCLDAKAAKDFLRNLERETMNAAGDIYLYRPASAADREKLAKANVLHATELYYGVKAVNAAGLGEAVVALERADDDPQTRRPRIL